MAEAELTVRSLDEDRLLRVMFEIVRRDRKEAAFGILLSLLGLAPSSFFVILFLTSHSNLNGPKIAGIGQSLGLLLLFAAVALISIAGLISSILKLWRLGRKKRELRTAMVAKGDSKESPGEPSPSQ